MIRKTYIIHKDTISIEILYECDNHINNSKNDLPSMITFADICFDNMVWHNRNCIHRDNDLISVLLISNSIFYLFDRFEYQCCKNDLFYRYKGYAEYDHEDLYKYLFINGICIELLKEYTDI